uniref:TIGR03086 family metal-binding protein n=1 Tax=Pseudonocardia lacus TaxID=2835865 RepID=UPI001BDC3327
QGPPPAEPPPLPADWRTALPDELDALVAAWRGADALTGTTAVGGVELPAPVAAAVALDELVLHGWDLARATGADYRPGSEEIAACMDFVEASARPEGVPGLFGPPVPVPDGAPELDRLLGLSGRDPAWSPPA